MLCCNVTFFIGAGTGRLLGVSLPLHALALLHALGKALSCALNAPSSILHQRTDSKHVRNHIISIFQPTLHATLYLLNMRSIITIKMPKMILFQQKPTL